jgi:amidohydrolase
VQRKRLSREVESLREEIVSLRRHFHSRPEACFRETETAGFIARYLKNLGLSVTENVAGTGVCALLEGEKPGKTLLYRADMDALEMEEESGLPFRSTRKGFAHSCGHDAHMAVALVAARVLAGRKKELRGSVKFVFQPCEESIPGGALAMIRAGVLENPPIDAVLGLHVWQELPSGAVGITAGPAFASIDLVTLKVRGKGGHGATPQLAVDPILISAHIITALEAVVSRETDPLEKKVLTFGELHAGTACNVIPETAVLRGTLRCFKSESPRRWEGAAR